MAKVRPTFELSEEEKQTTKSVDQKGENGTATDTKLSDKMTSYKVNRVKPMIPGKRTVKNSISPKLSYLTLAQQKQLKAVFDINPWPGKKQVVELAEKLNVENENSIRSWFHRKRRANNVDLRVNRFGKDDKAYLMAIYAKNQYPNKQETDGIAKELSVSAKKITIWFQNRRNRRSVNRRLRSGTKQDELQDARSNHQQVDSMFSDYYTKHQTLVLKEAYQKSKFLTNEELDALKEKTGLEHIQIRRWFSHKRFKDKISKDFCPYQKFTSDEILALEEAYHKNKYIPRKEMTALADTLGITQNRLYNWFRHKRKKDKSYKGIARIRYSADQTEILEVAYKNNPKPSKEGKEKIANELGISAAQIQCWFHKARQRYNHAYHRVLLTPQQKDALLNAYEKYTYPSKETITELANRAGIEELCVRRWLDNHRRKIKKLKATNFERWKPEEGSDEDMQDLKVEINVKVEPMDVDDMDQKKLLR